MARTGAFFALAIAAAMGGCSGTGPMSLSEAPSVQNPLALPAPQLAQQDCSSDPTDHMLAIDKRGEYRPISVDCGNGNVVYQVRPDHLDEDGCAPVVIDHPTLSDSQIRNYSALQCQIARIIEKLSVKVDGQPQHLVIFIHGGLVPQETSLNQALGDIPNMIADQEALRGIQDNATDKSVVLMKGGRVFPLFLNWPSGPFDTYFDSIAAYEQGTYSDGFVRHIESPLYLGNDVAEVGVRAPLELVKSVHRFVDAKHELASEDEGCGISHFGCNKIGSWERDPLDGTIYAILFPSRFITVPALDVGTRAWKNMIARTRFGVERYVDPDQYEDLFFAHNGQEGHDLKTEQTILTKGAFFLLFDQLEQKFYGKTTASVCDGHAPRISLISHSMGTMVSNELVREFPRLPYENIVFMAGATSIRDFEAMTQPVLARPGCNDLRFYDLTLHQEWDSREIEWHGVAPMGSLLAWIDDIFETPLTSIDRTFGKWENVVFADDEFDPEARRRMFFHRFGLENPDPIMHGQFAHVQDSRYVGCPPIPYWRPQFWALIRDLDGNACHNLGTLIHIDEAAAPRAIPQPRLGKH